jgi:putative ABC transport system permease protein
MRRLAKKLRAVWRRRQLDRDLEDELQFHLEMKAEDLGNRSEAHARVGNATALKEACRGLWTFANLESWWSDVRYAVRTLAKAPGFSLSAVAALALGIGADTAIFNIANGAFTWNLGLDHVDRVVLVNLTEPSRRQQFRASYADFRDLRSQTKTLAGLAAYQFQPVNLSDSKTLPERYYCVQMSANGFFVSEQKPALGRAFLPEDERPGAPAVIVLAYHVWRDRYGKDRAILGKTIRVDDVPRTVIGVMPPGKQFPEDTDLWTPLIPNTRLEQRATSDLTLFGRLADGVSVATARVELNTIAARLTAQHPDANQGLTIDLPTIAIITGAYGSRPLFVALWTAVGFVLLIACADVANMLLARGTGRMREIAIRVAIGAGRARIIRQLLIESVLLSLLGGFFGWLVALGGLRWFDAASSGAKRPAWFNISFDATAFAYLAAVSIGTGILFGLAPALRLARVEAHSAMKDGGHGATGGRRALSMASLLVVFEMALCVVLLAGAGLMIRSLVNLYDAPLGVNAANVLTMLLNLPEAKYPSPLDQIAFHRTLQTRLDALSGVESAAIVSNLPLGRWLPFSYELEGVPVEPGHSPEIGALIASPTYFGVMRVKPRLGRLFTAADGVAGAPVVIVNESFVAKFWPGENAIGKHLRLIRDRSAQPWLTVVGVLPDILQNFRSPLEHDPLIYMPYTEEPLRYMFIVARTRVPPAALIEAFRRTVQEIDPNLPVYDARSLESNLAQRRLPTAILTDVFAIFAVIALLLASLGLYAVMAHSISQRTQEIGMRMAVGGTSWDILRMVYAQGMRPLAVGMALGLPVAFGVAHILRMTLIGVSPGDPLTFLGAVAVLALAGALGCAVPALRAARLDPIVALRYE